MSSFLEEREAEGDVAPSKMQQLHNAMMEADGPTRLQMVQRLVDAVYGEFSEDAGASRPEEEVEEALAVSTAAAGWIAEALREPWACLDAVGEGSRSALAADTMASCAIVLLSATQMAVAAQGEGDTAREIAAASMDTAGLLLDVCCDALREGSPSPVRAVLASQRSTVVASVIEPTLLLARFIVTSPSIAAAVEGSLVRAACAAVILASSGGGGAEGSDAAAVCAEIVAASASASPALAAALMEDNCGASALGVAMRSSEGDAGVASIVLFALGALVVRAGQAPAPRAEADRSLPHALDGASEFMASLLEILRASLDACGRRPADPADCDAPVSKAVVDVADAVMHLASDAQKAAVRRAARELGLVDAIGGALLRLHAAGAASGALVLLPLLFRLAGVEEGLAAGPVGTAERSAGTFEAHVKGSSVDGAGDGLFVRGRAGAGVAVAVYHGQRRKAEHAEAWWRAAQPPATEYCAHLSDGSLVDGSPPAVQAAREAAGKGPAEGLRLLRPRLLEVSASMANHPPEGTPPNAVFYDVSCSHLPPGALPALPVRSVGADDGDAGRPLEKDDFLLVLATLRAVEDEEIFVDYAASGDLPAWYERVQGPLAGQKIVGRRKQ